MQAGHDFKWGIFICSFEGGGDGIAPADGSIVGGFIFCESVVIERREEPGQLGRSVSKQSDIRLALTPLDVL
jgi:hypothetical protein